MGRRGYEGGRLADETFEPVRSAYASYLPREDSINPFSRVGIFTEPEPRLITCQRCGSTLLHTTIKCINCGGPVNGNNG